jgi:hypothetical protein
LQWPTMTWLGNKYHAWRTGLWIRMTIVWCEARMATRLRPIARIVAYNWRCITCYGWKHFCLSAATNTLFKRYSLYASMTSVRVSTLL